MYGNLIPVGKCGNCGGVVSTPYLWWGVGRPPKQCESCGAYADEAANLPVLPMKPAPDFKAAFERCVERGMKKYKELFLAEGEQDATTLTDRPTRPSDGG